MFFPTYFYLVGTPQGKKSPKFPHFLQYGGVGLGWVRPSVGFFHTVFDGFPYIAIVIWCPIRFPSMGYSSSSRV